MYRQPIVVTGVAHAKVVHRFRRIERTQGTSTNTVFQSLIAPFHRPGNSKP